MGVDMKYGSYCFSMVHVNTLPISESGPAPSHIVTPIELPQVWSEFSCPMVLVTPYLSGAPGYRGPTYDYNKSIYTQGGFGILARLTPPLSLEGAGISSTTVTRCTLCLGHSKMI